MILDVTRNMLLDRGYHGLTMDRIAEAMEYSKGTIYQHFPCKEEVLAELAIVISEKRGKMIERAVAFEGRPRERLAAIGESTSLFAQLYPDDLRIVQIINSETITQKVSSLRQKRLNEATLKAIAFVIETIRDGVAAGDLDLPERTSPEDLAFGLWAITDGGYAAILEGMPLREMGVQNPFGSVLRNCELLLDGYGWRPLSTEWDYAKTVRLIHETIFMDEVQRLRSTQS